MIQVATPPAGPCPTPPNRPRTTALAGGRALLRATLAGALVSALAACAGSEGLPGLTPPHTNVQEVPANAFPTIGTTASSTKRPPLTPEGQQKLQRDLESLARTQDK
ncbi:hypothetical protein [Xanthobacter oligotrophicus]|uniref:hypothetical protein n=1 Tax=Xanthobacter oligotrophicus TaxID=2607286 RepID=UPI0011F2BDAF|nr:hypothetical protein [Xanthobacter oligotrophicus]MCG5237450.1 hypothetical protein [Xanthobacter oligotrophicus]